MDAFKKSLAPAARRQPEKQRLSLPRLIQLLSKMFQSGTERALLGCDSRDETLPQP
ncbi:hypothetical protein [Rhizobium esperanzae]|uniref:hypothetical protein n=1 Tax=Rhizobium esperanzae TaxID=1967781 RepID=UPI00159530C9|nr:hypothetical protein [Rhizobium esperanzae]